MNSLVQSSRKQVNIDNANGEVGSVVLPGDVISTAEEYVPGKNTAEMEGRIISLVYGNVRKDDRNLLISVSPFKRKKTVKTGDIVYGQVFKVDQRKASVKIGAAYDKETGVLQFNGEGYFNLPQQFDRNGAPFVRIGDIVRAKIVRTGDRGSELTITGKGLGILKTLCPRCRLPMVRKNGSLYCDNCEKSEMRKVAEDYGVIEIYGDMQ